MSNPEPFENNLTEAHVSVMVFENVKVYILERIVYLVIVKTIELHQYSLLT